MQRAWGTFESQGAKQPLGSLMCRQSQWGEKGGGKLEPMCAREHPCVHVSIHE